MNAEIEEAARAVLELHHAANVTATAAAGVVLARSILGQAPAPKAPTRRSFSFQLEEEKAPEPEPEPTE